MGVVQLNKGSFLSLYYVPDSLNAITLDSDLAIRDVYLKQVTLTAGAGIRCSAKTVNVTFSDNDGSGKWFASWFDCISYLNDVFNKDNSLKGIWNIAAGHAYLNYQNMEAFASGQVVVDQGVFGSAFGDELH